jgi:hypothetical protein
VTSEQLRYLHEVLEPYGADGCGDITTRANLQAWRAAGLGARPLAWFSLRAPRLPWACMEAPTRGP